MTIEKQNKCYLIASSILVVKSMIDSSSIFELSFLDNIVNVIFLIFIILKMKSQQYQIKDLVFFGCVGLICIYSCRINDNSYMILSFLLIIASQNINLREILRCLINIKIIIIVIHVLYSLIIFLAGESVPYIIRNGVIRYYFYLGQPNTFQMYLGWTTLEIFYVYFDELGEIHLLVALLVNIISFVFTNSNTSLQVLLITIILIILYKRKITGIENFITEVSKYSFFIIAILSGSMAYFYSRVSGVALNILHYINELTTGRLAYGAFALNKNGITLFGRKLVLSGLTLWNGQWYDALYLDSAYLKFIAAYGIVPMIIIGLGIYQCAKCKDIKTSIFLIAYILYGIMESYVLNASVCFPLLFLGIWYYGKRESDRMELT